MTHRLILAIFSTFLIFSPIEAQRSQRKEILAVFPFSGSSASDGANIASSLGRQKVLTDTFDIMLITPNAINARQEESLFLQDSGFYNSDSIFEVARAYDASYVIYGNLAKFGTQNLIIVSIMDVNSLQQIAGDYRVYNSISNIDNEIPNIAKRLADAVKRDTSRLPGLSVPYFNISSKVSQTDAQILSQILSCELANNNKYAVLPRNGNTDAIKAEINRQQEGNYNQDRRERLGDGRKADYVLAGAVEWFGEGSRATNKFVIDVLTYENLIFKESAERTYTDFSSQGIAMMRELALELTNPREAKRVTNTREKAEKKAAKDKAIADTKAQKDIKRKAFWKETFVNARRGGVSLSSAYYQWNDDFFSLGGSVLGIYGSPAPFLTIGAETKFGWAKTGNLDRNLFYASASPLLGIVIPFGKNIKIFGDALLELGYFGGNTGISLDPEVDPILTGIITDWATPGFDTGFTLWFPDKWPGGTSDGWGFDFKYGGTFFKDTYTHSVGVNVRMKW